MEATIQNENKSDQPTAASNLEQNTKAIPRNPLDEKSAQIEKDTVGNFVLKLYHCGLIHPKQWTIPKQNARVQFQKFIQQTNSNYDSNFVNKDIETLLRTNGFTSDEKDSQSFNILKKKVLDFRQAKLKELDKKQTENRPILKTNNTENDDVPLVADIEVETEDQEFPVVFQGGCKQQIQPNFVLTTLGCFICQKNFRIQSEYEDHIAFHGFDSDFEFLSEDNKKNEHIFQISYRLCKKSHYFSFTMKTNLEDIIIEKIIIVQTKLMQYVNNNKVPYELFQSGIDTFLLDSHLFTIGVEQPIVVIYRHKANKLDRFVEQHHFLRIEEFPQVHFSVTSYRLPQYKLMKTVQKLPDYEPALKAISGQGIKFSDAVLSGASKELRQYIEDGKVLSAGNCCNVLQHLLEIEDIEGSKTYAILRQKAAQIKRFGQEYSVRLQGIPKQLFLENILSPLDEIQLTQSDTDPKKGKKKIYHAIVERVYYNQVCFKYDKQVICEKKLYDIIFRPSRLLLKYQYRALDMLKSNVSSAKYLYPDLNPWKELANIDFKFFNTNIEKNPEQSQAVRNIADGQNMYVPYIIFGPPGTGKTSTIVEAVLQLWQRHPHTRILITAGSNGACDEVAIRLCRVFADLDPGNPNILRLFAKSNEKRIDSIDDVLIEASNLYGAHFYPAVEIIREYRIIVCTLAVVGKLVTGGIGTKFFTHVFVDECGASTEPEVLVSWMGTSSEKTRLIISGDHKQLGPIIRSKRASELGLDKSFMERLINRPCYEVDYKGDYDRSIQTRLVRNFRSHPEIVRLYNNLYYNSELKSMANGGEINWTLNWHYLPNKKLPIIFHSVYGSSKKTGSSSSLSNEDEVSAVIEYVKDLMYFGLNDRKIVETDIGIISPYKKQYCRIQEELALRKWHHIEVGAVETFQGKEKSIIIVSTVRSFTKTLGFLDDPRRLNVILSRPKALLIIIGNPKTLSQNKDFKYIIDECHQNRCKIFGQRHFDPEGYMEEKEGNILKKTISESTLRKPMRKRQKNVKQGQNANEVLNSKSQPVIQTEQNSSEKKDTQPINEKTPTNEVRSKHVAYIHERLESLKKAHAFQMQKNEENIKSLRNKTELMNSNRLVNPNPLQLRTATAQSTMQVESQATQSKTGKTNPNKVRSRHIAQLQERLEYLKLSQKTQMQKNEEYIQGLRKKAELLKPTYQLTKSLSLQYPAPALPRTQASLPKNAEPLKPNLIIPSRYNFVGGATRTQSQTPTTQASLPKNTELLRPNPPKILPRNDFLGGVTPIQSRTLTTQASLPNNAENLRPNTPRNDFLDGVTRTQSQTTNAFAQNQTSYLRKHDIPICSAQPIRRYENIDFKQTNQTESSFQRHTLRQPEKEHKAKKSSCELS